MYAFMYAKAIRISKFHCNGLTTVQNIQDSASLIYLGRSVLVTQRAILPLNCLTVAVLYFRYKAASKTSESNAIGRRRKREKSY